ncbi:MAG: glycosyltransferase [candidate division WOR-3 bacterium]
MKNLWIVYSSRKGGHRYPAESLFAYIMNYYRDKFKSVCINFLDFCSLASFFDSFGRFADLKLRKITKVCYKSAKENRSSLLIPYKKIISLIFKTGNLKRKLLSSFERPDLIISIQPEINAIAGLLKLWFEVPVYTVIIDLVAHGLWVDKNIDLFFVPNELVKRELLRYGVAANKIFITGIPIREGFRTVFKKEKDSLRKSLGIEMGLPTILIMGGLLGEMVNFIEILDSIGRIKIPHQTICIFGENIEGKKEVGKIKYPYKLLIRGVTENIYDWMWASDFIVTKPGSVTIAELTALGKPGIFVTPLAGSLQETKFAELLEEEEAGVWVERGEDVGKCIRELLLRPETIERIKKNSLLFGERNLYATEKIIEFIRKEFYG